MDNHLAVQKKKGQRSAAKKLSAGMIFLAAGLMIVSGPHGTRQSLAAPLTESSQATAVTPASMPSSFAELADKLSPTVVNVKVTKMEKAAFQGPHLQDRPFGDFFGQFFQGMPQVPKNYRARGAGSGVIISEDGYVLSNDHVVKGAREVTVTLDNKKEYKAEIVGRDPKTDLAVLKIEVPTALPVAALGNSDGLQVGDWVVAIGNPFGLSHTVTSGIVSAKGRVIGAGPYDDFIQTDASINPGNSGGPLFNMHGEVVGINTAIIPQGQGIGFAIPVNTAKPLIPQLVKSGEISRGYLGVNIQTITPELAAALQVEERKGALVADVVVDSPAAQAGIERGDIILDFDGNTVQDSRDLSVRVAATPVDEEVAVTVLRDGKQHQLSVQVGKLDSDEGVAHAGKPDKGTWGLQLRNLDPQVRGQLGLQAEQGVVVVAVEPGSAAAAAGIRQGDILVEVNRQAVDSVRAVKEEISRSPSRERLLLLVQRNNGKFYVPLEQRG